ncbi:hypothetical protein GCM10009646_63130 [Streptomyces aureus]
MCQARRATNASPTEGENDVPLGHTHIRKIVDAYLARHPDERGSLSALLDVSRPPPKMLPAGRPCPATSRAARWSSTTIGASYASGIWHPFTRPWRTCRVRGSDPAGGSAL